MFHAERIRVRNSEVHVRFAIFFTQHAEAHNDADIRASRCALALGSSYQVEIRRANA
jgi:hypothetical protein